jgi:hypothetical protein
MTLTARLWIFLVACLGAAAWLRLDFYPDTYYGDEEIPVAVVAQMEQHHSLDTNWKLGIWRKPADRWAYSYNQYNFSSYNSTLYYLHQLFGVRSHHINPATFNRVSSVIFQLATLAVIFFATLNLFGTTAAISAALFFTVNPLLVVDAHYARPESFLTLVTTLAIALHLLALKQHKNHLLLIAAFLWGIACACKFSLLPMAALAFALVLFQQHKFEQKQSRMAGLFIPAFLLGAFVLAPYLFLHPQVTLHGVLALFQQYLGGTTASPMQFTRSDLLLPKYLFIYFGVLVWPVMIAALFSADASRRRLSQLGWLVSGAYIIFFSLTSFFNESNLSHLAFVWCLLFAIGIQTLIEKFSGPASHFTPGVLLVLALAPPAVLAFLIHQQVYDASYRAGLESDAATYEAQVKTQCPGADAIEPLQQIAQLISDSPPRLLKISWMPRNEFEQMDEFLRLHHYHLAGEYLLPFHQLPHSQLQSIHYPAAYRYYCLEPGS